MTLFNKKLAYSLKKKKSLKVITGLDNTDIYSILMIAKAAELGKGTYLDIVANTKIVSIVKSLTYLPVCVSSIDPLELYNCAMAGADILELGNFDIFYEKEMLFDESIILNLAYKIRQLVPNKDICITIPHNLNLLKQINLAKNLEMIGINIIQTEAYSYNSKLKSGNFVPNHCSDIILKSTTSASLSSTYAISRSVNIPVIASSGINDISSSIAIFYGASGVGICSSIRYYQSLNAMIIYIQGIMHSFSLDSSNSKIDIERLFSRKKNSLSQHINNLII